ncbi:MAG TPA: hypothetical protein DCM07_06890, partial [Planctomycetaceae bacterium]|nr:hypothetical protein [Planctomycetaceae bacterium]
MNPRFRSSLLLLACTSVIFCGQTLPSEAAENRFQVRFLKSIHPQPFTGRVYLIFTRSGREPRLGPSWFQPESFIAR